MALTDCFQKSIQSSCNSKATVLFTCTILHQYHVFHLCVQLYLISLCVCVCARTCVFSPGDSGAFVTSPTSVFPPSASFPAPATQNAFPHESASNQEANGKRLLSFFFFVFIPMSFYLYILWSVLFSISCGDQKALHFNTHVSFWIFHNTA